MNAPRFPRSPDIHKRPFEDGKNPFADEEPVATGAKSETSASAYAASVVDDQSPKQKIDYEAFLPNRSRTLLTLGVIGAVLSGLSVLMALLAIVSADWVEGMFYGSPVSFTGIAFSVPAWAMSHGDLRAIRAGAMDPRGLRGTRIAYWCGCFGSTVCALPTIGGIAAIFMSI
jgi:hypothetical protein